MRFSLAQLRKISMPYNCSEELDLSGELVGFEDIKKSSIAKVSYKLFELGIDTYEIVMHIEIELIMSSVISLKDVPLLIDTTATELYSKEELDSNTFVIEGETIDTTEAVLTNILVNKPMGVKLDNETFDDDVSEEEDSSDINPAFASLKDLL